MSHPYGTSSLNSSRQPSHPSTFVTSMSPVNSNQSHAADLATSSQSILNSKLIPRNYLNLRSNPTTKQSGVIAEPTPENIRTNSQSQASNRQPDGAVRYTPTPTTTTSGKDTPESDLLGYEDLRLVSTRSPESSDSPSSLTGQLPKPDSPTLHIDNDPLQTIMPRASSIDSAISSVSKHSAHRTNTDVQDPSPASVRHLINTSGNVEKLVTHLLREKAHVSAQNAQLWKLVEKQRALLLGLNKDLERVTKERDRYKKKAKDLHQARNTSQGPGITPVDTTPVDTSVRRLPDQSSLHPHAQPQFQDLRSPMDPAMMPRPLHSRENSRSQTRTNPNDTGTSMDVVAPRARGDARPEPLRMGSDSSIDSQPSFSVTVATPVTDKMRKLSQTTRKAPPKPLNLGQPRDGLSASVQTSANSELTQFEEEPERGRRRTREEDDREREISAMKAEEARSQSMKDSKSSVKPMAVQSAAVEEHRAQTKPILSPPGLPLSPRPHHAALLSANPQQSASLAGALKSPGLPLSPRPMHNTATFPNSLPLSPRANLANMPLSPRAPKQPLQVPVDPITHTNPSAFRPPSRKAASESQSFSGHTEPDRLEKHVPSTSEPPQIYRGLVVASYPNLLLPPNALPSILIRVASFRLLQSRNSVLGLKSQEDSMVSSLAIISRSSRSELWRIEKVPSSLLHLEQQLRGRCADLPMMPDRKLFHGHSPAQMDTRRKAIDGYFDALLDIPIDEQAAALICRYLSTDVLDPDKPEPQSKTPSGDSPISHIANAVKTGYLTKKGKNFGGWKSRFFVLEGYELRYYESASGSHLGTIKIQNAQVGKSKHEIPKDGDHDEQFRHAFLIQEPKKRDTTTYIRHVLCAESDEDRDEWVTLLLRCAEGKFNDPQNVVHKTSNISEPDDTTSKGAHGNSPTPTPTPANTTRESPTQDHSQRDGRSAVGAISGPTNGTVIKDTAIWGHKQLQPVPILQNPSRDAKDKGYKMSNIFAFKKSDAPPSPLPVTQPKPRILRHNGYVRPVFGLPLMDAVEYCAPFHIEVELPAVVYRSIEYLRFRNAATEEGLFRLSGSNSTVRMLKERFNSEGDIDLVAEDEYHDVHAVASLFKSYLRELPASILTRELHAEFMKVLELSDQAQKITAYNSLVRRLPSINFTLLKELCGYLSEVTQLADKNKMTVRNMGIVFSPTLNIPPPVFNMFLTEFKAIFEQADGQSAIARTTQLAVPTLASTEIRSPRSQAFSQLLTPSHLQTTFTGLASEAQVTGSMTRPGDLGFTPIQPSYESGNYVSHLQDHSPFYHQSTVNGA